jgi:hypothetical protein
VGRNEHEVRKKAKAQRGIFPNEEAKQSTGEAGGLDRTYKIQQAQTKSLGNVMNVYHVRMFIGQSDSLQHEKRLNLELASYRGQETQTKTFMAAA